MLKLFLLACISGPYQTPQAAVTAAVTATIEQIGSTQKVISRRSPWQNGDCDRMVGAIRRDCLDHMIVLDELHLRRVQSRWRAACTIALSAKRPDRDPVGASGRGGLVCMVGPETAVVEHEPPRGSGHRSR